MKKGFCIAGICVGVVMIIIGLAGAKISADYYGSYPDSYTFGADFYTDMYKVTKEAANNIASLGYFMMTAMNTVAALIGRFMAALGAVVACFFGYKFAEIRETEAVGSEVKEPEKAEEKAEEVAEAVVETEEAVAETEEAEETVADKAETADSEEAAEVTEAVEEASEAAEVTEEAAGDVAEEAAAVKEKAEEL